MSQLATTITAEQLAEHNTRESLWIAVHGKVYDLTVFSAGHPGGIEVLQDCAGTDGTESFDYAGHRKESIPEMQQYLVGRLAESLEGHSRPHGVPEMAAITSSKRGVERTRFQNGLSVFVVVPLFTIVFLYLLVVLSRARPLLDTNSQSEDDEIAMGQAPSGRFIEGKLQAFGVGVAVASSVSCVGFYYLYTVFMMTLDYGEEAFSYPATRPRKINM